MPGLLYKNFRINFASFLFTLIFTIVCCALILIAAIVGKADGLTEGSGSLMLLLMYYVFFMMPSLTNTFLFEPDENRAACAFAMSLPTGGKGHIESKYWAILIQLLSILFLSFLTDTAVNAISGGAVQLTLFLMLIFCWRLLLTAIEVPFLIRFGTEKGISIKAVLVTLIIVLAAVYFLFGDISWLIGTEEPFKALIKWLSSGKYKLLIALFPFLSVGAYYLSCQISILVFRKGAENYEQ